MLDLLWTLLFYKTLVFLAVLTVLVFVHEMGHYLVAKWAGVRIVAFSVGFGPEIFGWYDKSGTRWKFCWIPLGGYVKMFGDLNAASAVDPESAYMSAEDKAVAFPYKPLYKRAAVVAAGPIANFILAFCIFAAVYSTVGKGFTPPEIGYVTAGSPADAAGIKAGDKVLSVNDRAVTKYEDIFIKEQLAIGEGLNFELDRNGTLITATATPVRVTEYNDACRKTTYNDVGLMGPVSNKISQLGATSGAASAGLAIGDVLTSINGTPLGHFQELRNVVRDLPGQQVSIGYERDGQAFTTTATLGSKQVCDKAGENINIGLLGVAPSSVSQVESFGIFSAMGQSVTDLWAFVEVTFQSIGQMVTGKRGTEDLGGPIGIANMVGNTAQVSFLQLLTLTAILSLNLGLINLFPIPVLDGGHLVLYAYEAIRGKPLGPKGQEIAFKIGFVLIISLMLFLFWNDILRAAGI